MSSNGAAPQPGALATLCYPQDRYPYIVTAVSPGGAKLTLEELSPAAKEPVGYAGAFPIWDCDGDPTTRTGRSVVAHRRRDGQYTVGGATLIVFGQARYYRDWSS